MSNTGSTSTATVRKGIGVFGLILVVMVVFKFAGMAGASWGLNFSWWWFVAFAGIWAGWVILWLGIAFFILLIAEYLKDK